MFRLSLLLSSLVLVMSACGDARDARSSAAYRDGGNRPSSWVRLPDPPLSPRTDALAAWTGTEVVVFGGWEYRCPHGAGCGPPQEPPFTDGAAFDPSTRTWRPITPAPTGIASAPAPVLVEGGVYALGSCVTADCPDRQSFLLRYRPVDDEWDVFPGVPGDRVHRLAAVGGELVAYRDSDELGEAPDWRFDPTTAAWQALPDDPLGPSYDRHVVESNGEMMLFAKPRHSASDLPPVRAARFDEAVGAWARLPDAPGSGYQAWAVDGVVVVNPHFTRDAGGGIFDPFAMSWAPLPDPPRDESWQGDMAGVVGAESAAYEYPGGWVLDVTSGTWIDVPTPDGRRRSGEAKVAAGRDLFVFGGMRWNEGDRGGGLVNEAWMWSATGRGAADPPDAAEPPGAAEPPDAPDAAEPPDAADGEGAVERATPWGRAAMELVLEATEVRAGEPVTLRLVNRGEVGLLTGLPFVVERWENGVWTEVPPPEHSAWPSIGIMLPRGGRTDVQTWVAGSVGPGHYRIVKSATAEDPDHERPDAGLTARAQFRVVE